MRYPSLIATLATVSAISGLAVPSSPAAQPDGSAFDAGLVYTAEQWRNLSGGIDEDSAYIDNLDATLEIDAERLWGWDDTRIFVYALYNNGRTLSEDKVGDLQVVSNIETGVQALRLYEAWIETPVADKGSLLFGLFDLNREFDVLESSGLFINSAHGIGTDIAQSGRNGPAIFPFTSLALRFYWQWNDRWGIRAAIFDGVPGDPADPDATAIQLGDGDGALLVTELEWMDERRRVIAGVWRYTADFEPWPVPSAPALERTGDDNDGFYLRGETALGGAGSGVSAFARAGFADGEYNIFSAFLGAGLTRDGPLQTRPQDTLGLAVAWAEASEDFQAVNDVEEREIKVELTYRMPIGNGVILQPDIQYIINPGLDPALDHAWAVGLRAQWTLLP